MEEFVYDRQYIRTCKYCGKEFISNIPSKQICDGPHYRVCEVCGKKFEVPTNRLYEKDLTCSKECSNIKRSKAIKAAIQIKPKGYNQANTVYHRKCKFCGKEFETNQPNRLYCYSDHYRNCKVCGEPIKIPYQYLTSKTFGNVCSKECRLKLRRSTSMMRYGVENYSQTKEWKSRVASNKEIADIRRRQTNIKKYGIENPGYTEISLLNRMQDPSKIDNLKQFKQDPVKFIESNYINRPTIKMLSNDLGINESSVGDNIHKLHIEEYVTIKRSSMELEISEFLMQIDPNMHIVHNDRNMIDPYEIDIYLPDYSIGIECNPTSTHNSTSNSWDTSIAGISSTYHKMKTDLAEQNGIFLFHLFGYEWNHKQEIMKSILRNLLGKSNRIYARKCKVVEVNSHTAMQFLDENHRQGALGSSIRLGLYYKDELVSLMTFGKSRHTIGDYKDCIELLRFCNTLNTSVVGGASKLFKYFLRNYSYSSIVSFSDRAHTSGNMYKMLGFKLDHISDPGYVWVDSKTDTAYHRYNAQKQNIKKFLKDDSIDLSQSESQIMESHGFVRVYDSGTCVWMYTDSEVTNV